MDAQEVKDRLQAVINSLIKDQPEEASKELHDVLAAKMRARISPEEETAVDPDDSTGEGDPVDSVDTTATQ